MNFARTSCAESLILCEGYMDVIAMHAAGVSNAVATLGTAITPEQARLISHYTKKVILSYDSDEAGQKATARALSLLEQVGLTVQILRIEGAKDPDEYIKKFGVDSFRRLLDGSHTKFEFNLQRVLSKQLGTLLCACGGGKEITAFASAILTAGNAAKPLDRFTMKDIGKIKTPMNLQICVSLACAHCCQLVSAAQRIAWENELVTAHMIDANLYPALVAQKNIQRVPMTFINGEAAFPGGKTMAELTGLLARYK